MAGGMALVGPEEEEEEACLGMGSREILGIHRLLDVVVGTIHTVHWDRWPKM